MRRSLRLDDLDSALEECRLLMRHGYRRGGNWTLGQICNHLRLTIDASVEGYPLWMTVLGYPLRPFLRGFVLPKLLVGNSPTGLRTAGIFVPAAVLDDADEIRQLEHSVERFRESGVLHAHPGFGKMAKPDFEKFHAAHAAHHLGFLGIVGDDSDSVE